MTLDYNMDYSKELDIINMKIKEIGNPITFNDVKKIQKLDKKAKIIRDKLK